VKLLGLIHTIMLSFSTLDSLLMLYIAIVRWKLDMHLLFGILSRILTPTNSNAYKENLQPFVIIDFFQDVDYHYINILDKLNLQTLHVRRHIDALFLVNLFRGTKFCPSVLEAVGLHVPTQNIQNFSVFSCSSSHCPTARCVCAADSVCTFVDIFSNLYLSLRNLVSSFLFCLLYCLFYTSCWLCNWPPAVELSM
jgi:hypothetical protein